MHVVADLRDRLLRWAVAGALVAFVCTLPGAWAQRFPPDPVQQLRLALQTPVVDPTSPEELAYRRDLVQKRIAALRNIGDLRRALALDVWKDEDRDIGPTDIPLRAELERRLTEGLRAVLTRGDATSQLAAVTMIGEMGVAIRETAKLVEEGKEKFVRPQRTGYARTFSDDLIRLVKGTDPTLGAAAARALGRINPPPGGAADALGGLFATGTPQERVAAADALNGMVRTVSSLAKGRSPYGVEAERIDVLDTGTAVVPVAARGVRDSNAAVRRSSVEAIQTAASALADMVGVPKQLQEGTPQGRKLSKIEADAAQRLRDTAIAEQNATLPLAQALATAAPVVGDALSDSNALVRVQAARALQAMGFVRLRMQRRLGGLPAGPGEARAPVSPDATLVLVDFEDVPKPKEVDPLGRALRAEVLVLAGRLTDPDVRVRLAAVDALEVVPDELAPVAPALIRALKDPDRFVRWAAARTLGKAAALAEVETPPLAARTAVPALTCLIGDTDLDVRVLGAMYALQRYGPYAAPAVATLAAAVNRGDSESRIAAINSLVALGFAAAPAVPALAEALSNTDARVRRLAAESLGKFGPDARSALPALQRALYDADDEVRRLAADSLLDIVGIAPRSKAK